MRSNGTVWGVFPNQDAWVCREGWVDEFGHLTWPRNYADAAPVQVYDDEGAAQSHADRLNADHVSG